MSRRNELRSYALARLTDGMIVAGLETSGGQRTHAARLRDLQIDLDFPNDLQYVSVTTLCARRGTYHPPGGGMPYTYDELPTLKLYRPGELFRELEDRAEEQRKLDPRGNLVPHWRGGPVSCSHCRSALHLIASDSA
jgi:hypothetical protein